MASHDQREGAFHHNRPHKPLQGILICSQFVKTPFFIAHAIRIARIRNDTPQFPEAFQVLQERVRENKNLFEDPVAIEGFVSVGLSWILMSLFGALPYVFSGTIPVYVDAFFETVSAVSTTGLSCGSTTVNLSMVGRVVIMVSMLCGRLGALAVVLLIGGQEERLSIRYPKEELVVG